MSDDNGVGKGIGTGFGIALGLLIAWLVIQVVVCGGCLALIGIGGAATGTGGQ